MFVASQSSCFLIDPLNSVGLLVLNVKLTKKYIGSEMPFSIYQIISHNIYIQVYCSQKYIFMCRGLSLITHTVMCVQKYNLNVNECYMVNYHGSQLLKLLIMI